MIVLAVALACVVLALVVRDTTLKTVAAIVAGILLAWWLLGYLQSNGSS